MEMHGDILEDVLILLDQSFHERADIDEKQLDGSPRFIDRERALEIHQHFKHFVEEWIESGIGEHGEEWISKRSLVKREQFSVFDGELYHRVKNNKPVESIPAVVNALGELFSSHVVSFNQHAAHPSFRLIGTGDSLNIGFDLLIYSFAGPKGGIQFEPKIWAERPPRLIAAWLFMEFFRSELPTRIMQCRSCKCFFIPSRKQKDFYLQGWHCPQHSKNAASSRSVEKGRKKSLQRKIEAAASSKNELVDRMVNNPTHDQIADDACLKLALKDHFKGFFVKKHIKKIEIEARRQRNAKSKRA